MYKNIIPTLIVIISLLGNNLYSQIDCSPYHKIKNYTIEEGVKYKFSIGLCHHYNSGSVELGYKNHYVSLISMTRKIYSSMIPMNDEFYIGYTYDYTIGKKGNHHIGSTLAFQIHNHEPVVRFYIDKRIYKRFFLHGSSIQVSNRINHLIGGFKVVI